eukprot:TRINITY_DN11020_c0_g1_i9.p1 TRINITY_DN11020_c0_g1~~TRINITY_DN11020_c0_g1_i9.p1  ORF type:complete len:550 (+),score=155.45 TRINITY_DN11020_c0_g1_i9:61-1650(+)
MCIRDSSKTNPRGLKVTIFVMSCLLHLFISTILCNYFDRCHDTTAGNLFANAFLQIGFSILAMYAVLSPNALYCMMNLKSYISDNTSSIDLFQYMVASANPSNVPLNAGGSGTTPGGTTTKHGGTTTTGKPGETPGADNFDDSFSDDSFDEAATRYRPPRVAFYILKLITDNYWSQTVYVILSIIISIFVFDESQRVIKDDFGLWLGGLFLGIVLDFVVLDVFITRVMSIISVRSLVGRLLMMRCYVNFEALLFGNQKALNELANPPTNLLSTLPSNQRSNTLAGGSNQFTKQKSTVTPAKGKGSDEGSSQTGQPNSSSDNLAKKGSKSKKGKKGVGKNGRPLNVAPEVAFELGFDEEIDIDARNIVIEFENNPLVDSEKASDNADSTPAELNKRVQTMEDDMKVLLAAEKGGISDTMRVNKAAEDDEGMELDISDNVPIGGASGSGSGNGTGTMSRQRTGPMMNRAKGPATGQTADVVPRKGDESGMSSYANYSSGSGSNNKTINNSNSKQFGQTCLLYTSPSPRDQA